MATVRRLFTTWHPEIDKSSRREIGSITSESTRTHPSMPDPRVPRRRGREARLEPREPAGPWRTRSATTLADEI